jgi:hypothetical protein
MSNPSDSFFAVNDSEGTSYVLDLTQSGDIKAISPASQASHFIAELLSRGLSQECVSNFIKGITIAYREMNADGMIGRPASAELIEESLLRVLNLNDDNIQPIWLEGVAASETYIIVVKPGFRELFKDVREFTMAMAMLV